MVGQVKKSKNSKSELLASEDALKKPYQKPAIAWEEKLESTAFMVQCLDGKEPGPIPQCQAAPFS